MTFFTFYFMRSNCLQSELDDIFAESQEPQPQPEVTTQDMEAQISKELAQIDKEHADKVQQAEKDKEAEQSKLIIEPC
jgi:hypothetical protein